MVSFFVRKESTLAWSRWLARVSFSSSPWRLLYWMRRSAIWALRPLRRVSASRARSSRPADRACLLWFSSFAACPSSWLICSSTRLRLVATSATPRRTFCSSSSWR